MEKLLKLFEEYNNTCSIKNIKDKCVTFARSIKYFEYLDRFSDKDAWIIVNELPIINSKCNLKFYLDPYPEYVFTLYHNQIYKKITPKQPTIGKNCKIHKTSVLDADGLKVINTPVGKKIQFKHTGKVVVGNDVEIGPHTVVHRGTLEDTIIGDGCKIGALTNIGHNCYIGSNTIIAAGVILNGGVCVGENCWISSGAMIRHYVYICDNVVIGLGAVVVKDIIEPGIYVGNPARYLKPVEEGWNF